MVHRPDRVSPDIDNRLIKPNEARSSLNLRMAASISDTDHSITLVNGMAEILYSEENPLPAGNNLVIGTKEDFESQSVFFALWNSNDNHGIYRIQSNNVELVIGGAILNFDPDSDVSIAIIDGKIYLTDNVNQPRMCNIQKGIDGDYPDPLEEWMITQIKRPPGVAPYVGNQTGGFVLTRPSYTLSEISDDYDNIYEGVSAGIQVAYYYIYDNDEESRLSPYSNIVFTLLDLFAEIPIPEYEQYLEGITLIKTVVFVYRRGNTGIWNILKTIDNTDGNKVLSDQLFFAGVTSTGFTLQAEIADAQFLPSDPVSASITNADFDAAPLLSATLEIAQNRLDLGNNLVDYPQWTGLTLDLTVTQKPQNNDDEVLFFDAAEKQLTFRPSARIPVGVELLDLWGRKIGVIASTTVEIPDYTIWSKGFSFATPIEFGEYNEFWYRDVNNRYQIDWELSGTLPDWCASYRIVRGKDQIATSFYRTVCRLYTWYKKDTSGEDSLFVLTIGDPPDRLIVNGLEGGNTTFYFYGYAMELTMGEPIEYTTGSNLYVKVIGGALSGDFNGPENYNVEFEIEKQTGNIFYFRYPKNISEDAYYVLGIDDDTVRQRSCFFDVEFIFKATSPDTNFYQTQYESIRQAADFSGTDSGTIQGDCYLTKYKKINQSIKKDVFYTTVGTPQGLETYSFYGDPQQIWGAAISMNPIDLYNQDAVSSIGQANVINEQQAQTRLPNVILFTDPIILGSRNNGLNKFNSIDNRQAPFENGPITALVRTSATQREPGVLLAIGTNGVSSFYYDGIQLTNVDGTANVSTSDKYLASQRPLVGNYGAQKLRNVCVTPLGTVYFWSENIKDWIRYTNAGLDQLGEIYGFMNYQRNQLSDSTEIMMTYDQVTDEAIMIGNASDALIFSERYKTFQGSREYLVDEIRPERGASIATRTFLFRQGHVWQMGPGVSVDDNSFFGELKDPTLTIVTNPEPMTVKRWNQIRMFGPLPSSTIMRSEPQEGTQDDTLVSHIDEGWWIQRKSNFDAAIRTAEDGDGEVLNGRIMESRLLISTFVWPAGSFVKLNYIEVKATRAPVQ